MLPDEEYKVVAYNTTNDLSLKEISVDYDMINYYLDEISFNLIKEDKKKDCSAGRGKDGEKDGRFFVEMLF